MAVDMNIDAILELGNIPELSEYIDLKDGLGRIRGNIKVYKSLLKSFLGNNSFDELKEQVAEGKLMDAAKTAHTIKGICANLSFIALRDAIIELEALLKAGSFDDAVFQKCLGAHEKTRKLIGELAEKL